MVKLEDLSFEKSVIETGYHIALPFSLDYFTDNGRIEIISYSFCLEIAEEFENKYSDDPFSAEARRFLYEKLSPLMESLDYDSNNAADRVHFEYRAPTGLTDLSHGICEIIDSLDDEKYEDLPLDEFEFDPDDPCDRMAIVRRDGRIVCYAGLNDICEDDGAYEITVECEAAYRNNGYGKTCVNALARHIIENGGNVKYVCTSENNASQKTAEVAGLRLYKKCLPFVCYKIQPADAEWDEHFRDFHAEP